VHEAHDRHDITLVVLLVLELHRLTVTLPIALLGRVLRRLASGQTIVVTRRLIASLSPNWNGQRHDGDGTENELHFSPSSLIDLHYC
jgi:hypothetical protein